MCQHGNLTSAYRTAIFEADRPQEYNVSFHKGCGMLQSVTSACPTTVDDTGTRATPRELKFNGDSLISVITYSALFVVAAVGNLTVFTILFRNRRRRSRVNLFIMHLSVADMIVTFVMLPLEIGWHGTVGWRAGDAACRAFMFFRVLGFYLSSFILITISFDRYFAIMHPLSLNDADRRGRLMLALAWLFSIVASIPQVGISILQNAKCMSNVLLASFEFRWYIVCHLQCLAKLRKPHL